MADQHQSTIHVRTHTLESLLDDNLRLYTLLERLAGAFSKWKGITGQRGGLLGEVKVALEAMR